MRNYHLLDSLGPTPEFGPGSINAGHLQLATAGRALAFADLPDRCIRYAFSDPSVGRDMHTIAADAWDTKNFEANPVFLWAHQDDELPIGRVEDLATEGPRLVGNVRYADHDMANTVYGLVKGGFLNATSTGWLPRKWKAANDRFRPGGLDFTDVELLEISQVPVPALPTALVTARKAGIDTRPLVSWAERLLDTHNFAILPREELMALRKFAKEPRESAVGPRPELVEGRQSAVGPRSEPVEGRPSAVASSSAAIPEAPVTEPAAPEPSAPKPVDISALARRALARGLDHVAALAYHLRSLEDLHQRMCDERDTEGDNSPVPDQMRSWLDDGHALLARSLGEESAEYHDGTQAPEPVYWSAADLEAAVSRALGAAGFQRKGAKHSAETLRCMRSTHAHVRKAHDELSALLADDDNDDDDNERALRARKAKALALKAKIGSRQ